MLEREWRSQANEVMQAAGVTVPTSVEQAPYNLVRPGSACPACKAPVRAWQNIPVLSYLLLRGRCANCRAPISIRYPLVEIAAGALTALVAWRFGFSLTFLGAAGLCWTLLALALIDLDHKLLPDRLTLPLLWAGLLFALLGDAALTDLRGAVIGAMAGYLSLWSVYQLFKLVTGKEGMGYGDFKLLAALGAWLGWQMLPLVIVLSAVVGAVTGIGMIIALGRDRQIPIPFGPFLAAAGVVALLWGEPLIAAYRAMSGI